MSRLIWPIQTGLPAKWSVVSQSRRCKRSLIERRLPARREGDRFAFIPASAKRAQDRGELADHYEVHRIARALLCFIGRRRGYRREPLHEGRQVALDPFLARINGVEIPPQVIGPNPGHGNRE